MAARRIPPPPVPDALSPAQFCFDRHVIDNSGAGADGVHLGDVNQDGFIDVVTGWEESAELKLYIHPGASVGESQAGWTSIDVSGGPNLAGVEDAAFADLNLDGNLDAIVSATEGEGAGRNRRTRIHLWDGSARLSDPGSWQGSVVFLDE